MQSLSKNQLAFLSSSVANKNIRPTLAYIYYLANKRVAVSTNSFTLSEVSIDLWEESFLMDTKGNKIPPISAKFPDYESFFTPESDAQKYTTLIDTDNLKLMTYYTKYNKYHTVINLHTNTIRNHGEPRDYIKYIIELSLGKTRNPNIFNHDIGINCEYLYNAIRYLDKTSKKWLTPIQVQSKNYLAPLNIYGTINWLKARSLIMPLKI